MSEKEDTKKRSLRVKSREELKQTLREENQCLISFVMCIYRGELMLEATFAKLITLAQDFGPGTNIEIIAVDDGSDDGSYQKILENQKKYPHKIRAVKLSRNFGSIAAIHAGLKLARGDCIVLVAQDLQDSPPELIKKMFESWRQGSKINFGVRVSRSEPWAKKTLAAAYHNIFRNFVIPDYPKGGFGSCLVDQQVVDEINRNPDTHVDLATRLFTLGYSRQMHGYHRSENPIGAKSNWTLAKSIKLATDNFLSFSYLPVRLMTVLGILVAAASFSFVAYVFIGKFTGLYVIDQPPGWATIVVLLSFFQGIIMIMLGVIGEYLWRIFDVARGRPHYLIDEIRED